MATVKREQRKAVNTEIMQPMCDWLSHETGFDVTKVVARSTRHLKWLQVEFTFVRNGVEYSATAKAKIQRDHPLPILRIKATKAMRAEVANWNY